MKQLYSRKETMKDFISFLQNSDYPAKDIITNDFINSLGYILSYLSTKGVFCLVDTYSVIVYCDGTHKHAKEFVKQTKTAYIIKEINNRKSQSIIKNYEYAIERAFDFLEYPF